MHTGYCFILTPPTSPSVLGKALADQFMYGPKTGSSRVFYHSLQSSPTIRRCATKWVHQLSPPRRPSQSEHSISCVKYATRTHPIPIRGVSTSRSSRGGPKYCPVLILGQAHYRLEWHLLLQPLAIAPPEVALRIRLRVGLGWVGLGWAQRSSGTFYSSL